MPVAAWRWIFPIPFSSAVAWPIAFGPPVRTGSPPYTVGHIAVNCLLVVALFACLLLIPFWDRFSRGNRLTAFWRARPRMWKRVVPLVALSVFALVFHLVRYDGALSSLVACRRLYKCEQWDALLEQARRNPYGDPRADRIGQDLYECEALAHQASRPEEETVKGALVGGGIGMLGGALLGGLSGRPVQGAMFGATAGGLAGGVSQGMNADQRFIHAYRNCMRNRGHNVID